MTELRRALGTEDLNNLRDYGKLAQETIDEIYKDIFLLSQIIGRRKATDAEMKHLIERYGEDDGRLLRQQQQEN